MFDSLQQRLETVFSKVRKKGILTEADVNSTLREIRLALLEADVNAKVAREFVEALKNDLVGKEITKSLNASQQIIKSVNEALINVLGREEFKITFSPSPPTKILLVGLQGTGKTTTSAKLAKLLKRNGRSVLLVGADLKRPAALEQLKILGEQVDVPVFSDQTDPVGVVKESLEHAKRTNRDVVIVDSAGRLTIDEDLMQEIKDVGTVLQPDYTWLVVDSMMGQEALATASAFSQAVSINGVILTKLDADSRGGAALSVTHVLKVPIVYASDGEKIDDFQLFYPERMASRILGMGDVLSLIEKAERHYDQEVAKKTAERLLEGRLTLDDFLVQLQQVKNMGPISNLISMLPGIPKEYKDVQIEDKELSRVEAIISAMTLKERIDPRIIDGSRKQRIARGSGTSVSDVNQLIKTFSEAQKMLGQMGILGGIAVKRIKKASKSKAKKGGRTTPKGGRL